MQYKAYRNIHKILCPVKCDSSSPMLPRVACGRTYQLIKVLVGTLWPLKSQKVSHFVVTSF